MGVGCRVRVRSRLGSRVRVRVKNTVKGWEKAGIYSLATVAKVGPCAPSSTTDSCTPRYAHSCEHAVLAVLWTRFCHTGPISLCVDLFVFVLCVFLFNTACCCIIVSMVGWT